MGNRPIHAAMLCYTTDDDSEESLSAVAAVVGASSCPPLIHEPNKQHAAAKTADATGNSGGQSGANNSREYQNYSSGPSRSVINLVHDDDSPKSTTAHPEFCTSMSSETLGREARTDNSNCGCVRGGGGGGGGGGGDRCTASLLGDDDDEQREVERDDLPPDDFDDADDIVPLSRQPSSVSESD